MATHHGSADLAPAFGADLPSSGSGSDRCPTPSTTRAAYGAPPCSPPTRCEPRRRSSPGWETPSCRRCSTATIRSGVSLCLSSGVLEEGHGVRAVSFVGEEAACGLAFEPAALHLRQRMTSFVGFALAESRRRSPRRRRRSHRSLRRPARDSPRTRSQRSRRPPESRWSSSATLVLVDDCTEVDDPTVRSPNWSCRRPWLSTSRRRPPRPLQCRLTAIGPPTPSRHASSAAPPRPLDGDILGHQLPLRLELPPLPGRALEVVDGAAEVGQVVPRSARWCRPVRRCRPDQSTS